MIRPARAKGHDSTDFEYRRYPQLHMKAGLIAWREAWRLLAREGWADLTRQCVLPLMARVSSRGAAVPDELAHHGDTDATP